MTGLQLLTVNINVKWRAWNLCFRAAPNKLAPPRMLLGGGQVPKGMHMSPLPAVSKTCGNESIELYANSFLSQVSPTRQPLGWATLLPSLGRTPTAKASPSRRRIGASMVVGDSGHPPKPNASLVARLSLASAKDRRDQRSPV